MITEQTRQEIIEILASQLSLDVSDITENSDIVGTLGADSLDIVELVTAYEDKYGIEVPDSAIMKIKHVSDIFKYVEQNTDIT